MNWLLFGAAGAAIANDPQVGDRMLSVVIYMSCFVPPLVPLLIVGCKKQAYEAVRSMLWAKVAIISIAVLGITGVVLIGLLLSMQQTTFPVFVATSISAVSGLLVVNFAERKYWAGQ